MTLHAVSLPDAASQRGLPTRIGRFYIKHELGRGSLGIVYLAHDPIIDRDIALKILPPRLSQVEKKLHEQQLINEARAAGRLAHANIVTIYETATEGGITYIAMEYLQGKELSKLLDKEGQRFNAEEVASITWKIAEALEHAHKNGVVHRDIKPANIFMIDDQQPKLVDFGIARTPNRISDMPQQSDSPETLFHDNIMGTPNYMSPEQALGQPVDARADIYSLGAVMFEMLTFRKPFQAEDTRKLLHQIVFNAVPEPHTLEPSIPDTLSRIVMKAMAKKVERRYQTAGEMALDIKRYLRRSRRDAQHIKTHAKKEPPRPYRLARMSLFLSICSVSLGVAIVVYTMWRH